jgi:transcriptional regulator with XRE-family HTH domain
MSILSDRIREGREYLNFPPERMAAELGASVAEYVAFESGETVPTGDQLAAIAWLCGTTPERLQGGELRADPRTERAMAGADVTHDDAWEVHRFAEFLKVRATVDPREAS